MVIALGLAIIGAIFASCVVAIKDALWIIRVARFEAAMGYEDRVELEARFRAVEAEFAVGGPDNAL